MDDDDFVSESTLVHGQVWDIVTSCGKPKVENCAWYLIRTSGFINSPCEYRSQETLACDWICSFWGTMRWGCSYGWAMGCWCLTCGFTHLFAEHAAFWCILKDLPMLTTRNDTFNYIQEYPLKISQVVYIYMLKPPLYLFMALWHYGHIYIYTHCLYYYD